MRRFTVVSFGVVALILAWCFGFSTAQNRWPIPYLEAISNTLSFSWLKDHNAGGSKTENSPLQLLKDEFNSALQLIHAKRTEEARHLLSDMVTRYSQVPELYLNLAALHVQNNDLESARSILVEGLQNLQQSSPIFIALQRVSGRLASRSYLASIGETLQDQNSINLEVINELKPNSLASVLQEEDSQP